MGWRDAEKLGETYERYLQVKDNAAELEKLKDEFRENPCIWHVFECFVKSVKENDNTFVGIDSNFWFLDGRIKEMTDALDYWGIEKFVLYDNSTVGFKEVKSFCDHGWKLYGMCTVACGVPADPDRKTVGIALCRNTMCLTVDKPYDIKLRFYKDDSSSDILIAHVYGHAMAVRVMEDAAPIHLSPDDYPYSIVMMDGNKEVVDEVRLEINGWIKHHEEYQKWYDEWLEYRLYGKADD